MLTNMMITKVIVIAVLIAVSLAGCDTVPPLPEYHAPGPVESGDGQNAQGEEHHGNPIQAPDGADQLPDEASTTATASATPTTIATPTAATTQYNGDDFDPAQQGSPSDAPNASTTPAEPSPPSGDSGGTGSMPPSGCADSSVLTPEQALKCWKQHQEVNDLPDSIGGLFP